MLGSPKNKGLEKIKFYSMSLFLFSYISSLLNHNKNHCHMRLKIKVEFFSINLEKNDALGTPTEKNGIIKLLH